MVSGTAFRGMPTQPPVTVWQTFGLQSEVNTVLRDRTWGRGGLATASFEYVRVQ